jgi:predicted dehydrogenase
MADTKTLKIGIAGSESRSQSYARALGQVEGARVTAAAAGGRLAVELQRTIPGLVVERDAGGLIRRSNVDAVVLADPVADLAGVIRRALLSDRHVLATISSPITGRQLDELASLARRRQRLLMFTEERSFHPALVFLKWMLSGRSGLWQPRYVRAVSAPGVGHGGSVSIASLIVEELAICGRLLGESPHSVSGVVCRVEAEALPAAAFINLIYASGRVASLQLSTTEAQESREWALATPSKTVLLDECDVRSPLKIISFDSEATPGSLLRVNPPIPLADWPAESTVTPPLGPTDVRVDQCRHFVESILNHELHASNAEFWSEVALVWEAAQESIRLEGMPVDVSATLDRNKRVAGERPKLRLIRGKGMGTVEARKRPALTLVPR